MCLSFRPVKCGWLGSCTEKNLCCQNRMVQSRIRVGPTSFHSWQHQCQILWRSREMHPPGPDGMAARDQPTPYMAGNGECPEEPHSSTTPISRANSKWTISTTSISISSTTSQVTRFVWLLQLHLVRVGATYWIGFPKLNNVYTVQLRVCIQSAANTSENVWICWYPSRWIEVIVFISMCLPGPFPCALLN